MYPEIDPDCGSECDNITRFKNLALLLDQANIDVQDYRAPIVEIILYNFTGAPHSLHLPENKTFNTKYEIFKNKHVKLTIRYLHK